MHGVVPDLFMPNGKQYSSCLHANAPASNEHQRKRPWDPHSCFPWPSPNCMSTLCLPAAMHVVRYSRPSPSVSHFCIIQLWWKACENMWIYSTRVVAVDNKVHFSKNSSINSKQPAFLVMWEKLHITASAGTFSMQVLRTLPSFNSHSVPVSTLSICAIQQGFAFQYSFLSPVKIKI